MCEAAPGELKPLLVLLFFFPSSTTPILRETHNLLLAIHIHQLHYQQIQPQLTHKTSTMPGRLLNKVAIVTGSSSGLGRAIALAYAAEGAKVVCADLSSTARKDVVIEQEQGKPTHEEIIKLGGVSFFFMADVGNSNDLQCLVRAAVAKYGRLDM